MIKIVKHLCEIKLEKRDQKIIYILNDNLKFSRKKLANMLRISPENLNYRIKRLKKELISPAAILNFQKLGFRAYLLFFENLNEKIFDQLTSNDNTHILTELMGAKRHMICIVCHDLEVFCQKNMSNLKFEVHEVINIHIDDFNPFKIRPRNIRKLKKNGRLQLNKFHHKIILGIIDDPQNSIFDLSKKLHIDRATVKKYLKELEDFDYIRKYRFALDNYKIGFTAYLLQISCTSGEKKIILEHIKNDDYSGTVYETYNGFLTGYLCKSQHDVSTFFDKLKKQFPEASIVINQVGDYHINPIPESVKKFLKENSD